MKNCTRVSVFCLLVLVLNAQRSPAPIQETEETPTPAAAQSSTPSSGESGRVSPEPLQLPRAGYSTKTYAATGLIERLDPDLILLQKGHETWMARRASETQVNGAPKPGDMATVVYWMVAAKDDRKTATYKISGSILEIDDTKIVLEKGGNRWEIACDREKISGRGGDNVAVTYQLVAKSITRTGGNR